MNKLWIPLLLLASLGFAPARHLDGADRDQIAGSAMQLAQHAADMAEEIFSGFKGRNNEINDREQAILFKTESFSAACRLFARLAGSESDYFMPNYLRTNLYTAFLTLARSFQELEESMNIGGRKPGVLLDCKRRLEEIERQFSRWPTPDNLAYLDQKYVKARDSRVFLVERRGTGQFSRRLFPSLESLWRFHYQTNRGKDPWKYLVEVPFETLEKMEQLQPIVLTFEGCLIMDMSNRPGQPVFLIQNGRKRGLTSIQVLERLGGWKRVFEVPPEVIASYPEGEPVL